MRRPTNGWIDIPTRILKPEIKDNGYINILNNVLMKI